MINYYDFLLANVVNEKGRKKAKSRSFVQNIS